MFVFHLSRWNSSQASWKKRCHGPSSRSPANVRYRPIEKPYGWSVSHYGPQSFQEPLLKQTISWYSMSLLQALDMLLYKKGHFEVANVTQNVDRMPMVFKPEDPMMCLTPTPQFLTPWSKPISTATLCDDIMVQISMTSYSGLKANTSWETRNALWLVSWPLFDNAVIGRWQFCDRLSIISPAQLRHRVLNSDGIASVSDVSPSIQSSRHLPALKSQGCLLLFSMKHLFHECHSGFAANGRECYGFTGCGSGAYHWSMRSRSHSGPAVSAFQVDSSDYSSDDCVSNEWVRNGEKKHQLAHLQCIRCTWNTQCNRLLYFSFLADVILRWGSHGCKYRNYLANQETGRP